MAMLTLILLLKTLAHTLNKNFAIDFTFSLCIIFKKCTKDVISILDIPWNKISPGHELFNKPKQVNNLKKFINRELYIFNRLNN